ncbi:folylpolyglutamate synthase, variant 2 [Metarhizium acridum]|nr:folylpolyglutamate synthase, variant 2 [Metarhizium acridum]
MPAARDIQRALARIRAVMPAQKQSAMTNRNIKLGLERISRVVPEEQKWIGVHVGGTNGKGSICALLAGMFKLSGISHGTYISPALPERHNAITINGLYINKRMYEMELQHVEEAYKRASSGWTFAAGDEPGDLTPFELETAAAFRVFNKMNVQYGIVEVGMGGATDATNAMKEKAVTIISKIDLDHQEYLGNTIEEIAKVKAGIMRPGTPCIVDHTNPSSVMDVLRDHARTVGTQVSLSSKALPFIESLDRDMFKLQDYEQQNLLCATLAFRNLFPHLHIDVNKLLALRPQLPGRMEQVSVAGLTDGTRQKPVLVDGAHNMLGVEALAKYVDGSLRNTGEPVTWVIGLSSSKTKPFSKIIETLIRPQDNLAFVEYAQGPNDPPPAPADLGRGVATQIIQDESRIYDGEPNIGNGVQWACSKAGDGPVVITGSLYMIREFYKMEGVEPSRKIKTRRPGSSSKPEDTGISPP